MASVHRSGLVRASLGGVPAADLGRLRAPCGLDLGGRSPALVALAVLAEVLAVARGARP